MHDARKTQIKMYYGNGIIQQDAQLIDFIQQQKIKRITIKNPQDLIYFSQQIPEVDISNQFAEDSFFYVILEKNPYLCWELFLEQLINDVNRYRPDWLYVAVNQYVITTQIEWPNLSDNYPQDLLNSLSLCLPDYCELKRNDPVDLGQNFNFAHPTTYAYFQRTDT
jgi:hypothetical protein